MSGSESYESLKISFANAWNEINEVIADGEVEIKSGQKVPVEVFLGEDYEVCIIKISIFIHLSIQTDADNKLQICVYNVSVGVFLFRWIFYLFYSQFLLVVSGRSAANSSYACIWCKIHKHER